MARMHSRKHGKHGSKKPVKKMNPEHLIYDADETKELVKKLSKNLTPAEVGLKLRDQYGIPDVRILGLRIGKIIQKEMPEDIYNLIKKAVKIHGHLQANKKDAGSIHALQLVESKVRRLGKYYTRTGKLPKDWKYSIDRAKLIVK